MAQNAPSKHVPMRTCIATGEQKPKRELLRIVRLGDLADVSEFVIKVDPKGKLRGRGANITPTTDAFDLAVKKGAIERALKLPRKLNETELAALRAEFSEAVWNREFRKGQKKVVLKVSKQQMEEKLK